MRKVVGRIPLARDEARSLSRSARYSTWTCVSRAGAARFFYRTERRSRPLGWALSGGGALRVFRVRPVRAVGQNSLLRVLSTNGPPESSGTSSSRMSSAACSPDVTLSTNSSPSSSARSSSAAPRMSSSSRAGPSSLPRSPRSSAFSSFTSDGWAATRTPFGVVEFNLPLRAPTRPGPGALMRPGEAAPKGATLLLRDEGPEAQPEAPNLWRGGPRATMWKEGANDSVSTSPTQATWVGQGFDDPLAVRGTWRSAPASLSTATWAPGLSARCSRRADRSQLALLLNQLSALLPDSLHHGAFRLSFTKTRS